VVTPFPVPNDTNVGASHVTSLHARPNEDSSQAPTSAWTITTPTSHQSNIANADVKASGIGQMSSMQNESAIQYGLTIPHAGGMMVRNLSATASSGPGLSTRMSSADMLQGVEVEAGPPSYDEVTLGRHR